jgi:hypothetical protein
MIRLEEIVLKKKRKPARFSKRGAQGPFKLPIFLDKNRKGDLPCRKNRFMEKIAWKIEFRGCDPFMDLAG